MTEYGICMGCKRSYGHHPDCWYGPKQSRSNSPFTPQKAPDMANTDQPQAIGLYAPGFYSCHCLLCGQHFMGDKRAVHCHPCAVKVQPVASAGDPPQRPPLEHLLTLIQAVMEGVQDMMGRTSVHTDDNAMACLDEMWGNLQSAEKLASVPNAGTVATRLRSALAPLIDKAEAARARTADDCERKYQEGLSDGMDTAARMADAVEEEVRSTPTRGTDYEPEAYLVPVSDYAGEQDEIDAYVDGFLGSMPGPGTKEKS